MRSLKTYPNELKESVVARMLPPTNASVPQLVRETGIPRDTLYGWRRQALAQAVVPAAPQPGAGAPLSGAAKLAAIIETAALNELELGEYCRRTGLFPQQIAAWRTSCEQAVEPLPSKAERAERRAEREEIKRLTRELDRKEKALAEAAALLVLQKKMRTLWEEDADAPSRSSGAGR
jgi:transposase